MGKKSKLAAKTQTPQTLEQSTQPVSPAVASDTLGTERKSDRKWPKKVLILTLVLLVFATVAGIAVYHMHKNSHKNIVIGAITITPQDINAFSREVSTYAKTYNVNFGRPAKQVAQDDLILNAALKDQAAKHKIVVSQNDIDAQFAGRYQQYGSKSAYESYVKKAGFPNFVEVVAENNTYESKLYTAVIASKNVFVVSINIDTPYIGSSKNPSALRTQATNTMQTKFLPMFKKGWSDTKIASQTNINLLSGPISPNVIDQYYTSMPAQADIVYDCTTANPCFNDQPKYELPGIVTTESKVESLTKVGQYTGVFTSKAGFIGIIRLDHKSEGTYNSWSQFLQGYKNRYKSQLVAYLLNGSMYNQTEWS